MQGRSFGMGTPFIYMTQTFFTDPAAGAQVAFTVPAGKIWIIHRLTIQLLTTAVAGNRFLILVIGGGSAALGASYIGSSTILQAASNSYRYQFDAAGSGGVADHLTMTGLEATRIPMGQPLYVGPGGNVRTLVSGMDAGDQISVANKHCFIEEYNAAGTT